MANVLFFLFPCWIIAIQCFCLDLFLASLHISFIIWVNAQDWNRGVSWLEFFEYQDCRHNCRSHWGYAHFLPSLPLLTENVENGTTMMSEYVVMIAYEWSALHSSVNITMTFHIPWEDMDMDISSWSERPQDDESSCKMAALSSSLSTGRRLRRRTGFVSEATSVKRRHTSKSTFIVGNSYYLNWSWVGVFAREEYEPK